MTIQNISMRAGNAKTITATVTDVVLSDGYLTFSLYKDDTVILTKQDITVTGNTFTLYLFSSDTKGLTGEYAYEITITDDYGNETNLFDGVFSFTTGNGITAQQVFVTAMDLMGEESEDGTYEGYPQEYKKKSWSVLTMLQAELTPATVTPSVIMDENSLFFLDDRTTLMVLPYGLAAHLMMEEDPNRASFFNSRYDELKRKRPAKITKIQDVYGMYPTDEQPQIQQETTTRIIYDGGDF
ncbi:hypothetical protein J1P26_07435 [Neobacillus sp. MM2021_6]|uniref:hypothetical protein n=1 Tax=Bacillaceae TaxID=186817 RepID=UPI00140967BE|nr:MULTISPECIES: hypothetical protein [Bacillaceae]MBO0959565.1 hypothetical protein [Neobacillus sp. MM2021_6]NHC17137.1 hypothetical protein [Bacillus sp. MM2020_4]